MFGFLRRIFGNTSKQERSNQTANSSRPRQILYDSKLVGSLKSDHRDLLQLYRSIGVIFEKGRYNEIPVLLTKFKTRLEAHLLTENVTFYNYLEQSLTEDEVNYQIMRDFRREMNSIARAVITFVKKYQRMPIAADNKNQFKEEYDGIGSALIERITREEKNLYPMYDAI